MPLTILNILKGLLTMGLTLILVVLYDFKALGILYSNLIITLIFAVVFSVITVKNMVWVFDWGQIKSALRFSLPLLPGSLAYYLVTMSDRVLIESYLGTYDLGIYSTAATLAMVLNIVSYGAYKAFEPYFFKTYGNPEFDDKFQKIHDNFIFLMLAGVLALSIYAKEFFELFSSEAYHVAYVYVPVILIGTLFSSVSMLYATIVTARNKTQINSLITIVGGGISILLNVLFLSRYGIVIACLVSAVSFGIICYLSYYYAKIKIRLARSLVTLALNTLCTLILVYYCSFENMIWSISIKAIALIGILIIDGKLLKIDVINLVKEVNVSALLNKR